MFFLLGCTNSSNYGPVDSHCIITDVNKANKEILLDDKDNGPIWLDLSEIKNWDDYHSPLEVNVWLKDGITESDIQEGYAVNIQIVNRVNNRLLYFQSWFYNEPQVFTHNLLTFGFVFAFYYGLFRIEQ
jgi:hypothetical protein